MTHEQNLYLAQIAYNAYGDFRGWKTHDGKPMPQWNLLTLPIKDAWLVAVNAVVTEYEKAGEK